MLLRFSPSVVSIGCVIRVIRRRTSCWSYYPRYVTIFFPHGVTSVLPPKLPAEHRRRELARCGDRRGPRFVVYTSRFQFSRRPSRKFGNRRVRRNGSARLWIARMLSRTKRALMVLACIRAGSLLSLLVAEAE